MRLTPLAVLVALACLLVPAVGMSRERPPPDVAGLEAGSAERLCGDVPSGVQCGDGGGRQTSGGGEKVSHRGWPAVTGILWKVLDSSSRTKIGGPANDELLGHHGSDRLTGGSGKGKPLGGWGPRDKKNQHRHGRRGGGGGGDH